MADIRGNAWGAGNIMVNDSRLSLRERDGDGSGLALRWAGADQGVARSELAAGTGEASAGAYATPPIYTYDQMANQLTHADWGGDWHAFNVDPGGSITVNLIGLTSSGQSLARSALAAWGDIIGVTFVEVGGSAQITFDDNQAGAFAESVWSNHVILSSNVNVSINWLNSYGTGLNSYSYQTYLHEVGHALGLGHAGNYDGGAAYPTNAVYANDSWATSVMSYFSQWDNTYFLNQGFTEQFVLTPMNADVVAMQVLYGTSTTTRTGNTTYGFNSNASNPVYNATQFPAAAYTIVDSGGTDTLDYSGYSANQTINLNQETFSNVGGNIGNVVVGRGTVIENAIGGAGHDTIIGNAANNVLNGGLGTDTVSYATAASAVTVSLALSSSQATGGAGSDTLTSIENLIGSAHNDTLTGNLSVNSLNGGSGDDFLYGGAGADTLTGGAGSDRFHFDSALGSGVDAITDFGSGDGIHLSTTVFTTLVAGALPSAAFVQGSAATTAGHRIVYNSATGQILYDSDGSGATAAVVFATVAPGTALTAAAFTVYGSSPPPSTTVQSSVTYTLASGEVNLVLTGTSAINGTGNSLANQITGNSAANTLSGLGGNDTLDGGAGNDTLNGGTGADTMTGGLGNDIFMVDNSGDVVNEAASAGIDTVSASITYVLGATIERLQLSGLAAINGTGNSLDNSLTGNNGANILTGLGGNDILTGGGGNDTLYGDSGADSLQGGVGVDQLYGGTGADRFIFRSGDSAATTTTDKIWDFSRPEADRIVLNGIDANPGLTGDQAFAFIGTGAFSGAAGQLRYQQVGGDTFVQGDINGDGVADFQIAVAGLHAFVATDFVL